MQYRLGQIAYNRERAVEYAHYWAYRRNPDYYDFEGIGGDCTNFASQCIYAGSGVMNFTPTYGWYYLSLQDRAPAWTGVPYLYNFLTKNEGPGPYGREVPMEEVEAGDICQLMLTKDVWQHTPFIVKVGSEPTLGNIRIAAHSYDADDRPLNTYNFRAIRFVHIEGVRYIENVDAPPAQVK